MVRVYHGLRTTGYILPMSFMQINCLRYRYKYTIPTQPQQNDAIKTWYSFDCIFKKIIRLPTTNNYQKSSYHVMIFYSTTTILLLFI